MTASDVFVLVFSGANNSRPAGFPAFAVWTNVSMCGSTSGPRYPCADAGDGGLDACLAAACCYDENTPAGQPACFEYPFADEPLQAAFEAPTPAPPDACWSLVDFAGYSRGQSCAVGGVLVANVTDGPLYYL